MTGEIVNHLWQSTVFAILAGLLALAFRKHRAQVRYWIWFSASVRFLVPFALLLTLGGYLGRSPAAKSVPVPAITSTVVEVAMPFPVTPLPTPSPGQNVDWIPRTLISLWLCGALGIALLRARAWVRIRAAVRNSKSLQIPFPVPVRSSPHALEPGLVGIFEPV
jgi:beta-lactamase regulating signal transducer with metallopeptidase domain